MTFFGKVKRFACVTLALVNVVVVAALIVTGYAGAADPSVHPHAEMLVLSFPIPLVINAVFLLFWLFFNYKYAIIPLLGFLLCWGPTRAYCPVNLPSDESKEGIKVLSFNVCGLVKTDVEEAVDYFKKQDADIVCLQEAPFVFLKRKEFNEAMAPLYPYSSIVRRKLGEYICLFSKNPIIFSEDMPFESKKNICAAFHVDMGEDTILVVNVHLETMGLKVKEREQIGDIIKRKDIDEVDQPVFDKICASSARRAPQVDIVSKYLQNNDEMPTILCGDFNDIPNSYAYRSVDKYLDNCYQSKGIGPGFTFTKYGMFVRIDNIFCSDDFVISSCKVDTKTQLSDHYPIIATIKKRTNP